MPGYVNVNIQYVLRLPGFMANRHHRTPSNPGSVVIYPTSPQSPEEWLSNAPHQLAPAPPSYSVQISGLFNDSPVTVYFAFWLISVQNQGPVILTESAPILNVGDGDINATAYYGAYGFGPGANAIILDAFDEDVNVNNFVNDNFVTVIPASIDPQDIDTPPSDIANDGCLPTEGWAQVDPALTQCKIKAYPQIHGAAKFLFWLIPQDLVASPGIQVDPSNPDTLLVDAGCEAWAFAFYKTPAPVPPTYDCAGMLRTINQLKQEAASVWNAGHGAGIGNPSGSPNWTNSTDQTRWEAIQQELAECEQAYRLFCGPTPVRRHPPIIQIKRPL